MVRGDLQALDLLEFNHFRDQQALNDGRNSRPAGSPSGGGGGAASDRHAEHRLTAWQLFSKWQRRGVRGAYASRDALPKFISVARRAVQAQFPPGALRPAAPEAC